MTRADDGNGREQQRKRTVILFWVAVAGLAVTILQFAPTAAHWTGDAGAAIIHLVAGKPPSEVSVVLESRLVNRQPEYGLVAHHSVPTRLTAPQIDLYVRNEGDDTVHLSKAKIEVLDAAVFEMCMPPQGGGPEVPPFELSYFVNLPPGRLPDERPIFRTLHQNVAPGGDGVVNLYLRTLEAESLTVAYALQVTLLTDDPGASLDAGRFVVAIPGPVSRYGNTLPESRSSIEDLYAFDSTLESTWCYRRNMATVSRLLAWPGKRSPAMKALASVQPAPNWSAYADRRPARVAAEALLSEPTFLDTPSLAVFAAAQTGDARFQREIERRASAILLRFVDARLESTPKRAIFAARAALGFEASSAGQEALAHAEASLRRAEDASGELSG